MNRKEITSVITTIITIVVVGYALYTRESIPPVTALPAIQQHNGTNDVPLWDVIRVIDGDIITVRRDTQTETVRLIGIDTPETVKPRTAVECFGREASTYLTQRLTMQSVHLVSDNTQSKRDRYDRLLAYVYLPQGVLINQEIITKGFAYEYTYDSPYYHQDSFKQAEREARTAQRGLWNPTVCPEYQ